MKKAFYLIIVFFMLICNIKNNVCEAQVGAKISLKDISKEDSIKSKYYALNDSVIITIETDKFIKISKEKYNKIIDNHPELYNYDYPNEPDLVHYKNVNTADFKSEAGQDAYYILYAHFLKGKNGIKKYKEQRKNLIEIYKKINHFFGYLQYGGTYFGHQQSRILGYAEYSIYLYSQIENNIEKTYNIKKQKEYYIKSLRQLIEDESKIDNYTLGEGKIERSKKLNKIVDKLDELITDIFYLRRAQEFHYHHYEFY